MTSQDASGSQNAAQAPVDFLAFGREAGTRDGMNKTFKPLPETDEIFASQENPRRAFASYYCGYCRGYRDKAGRTASALRGIIGYIVSQREPAAV